MHHDWRALGFHGNDRIQLPCRYRDLKITEPKNSFSETYPDMFSKLRDQIQRAKKVVSDSPGLVDFAIRLVNSVTNLPDGQVIFFEEFE